MPNIDDLLTKYFLDASDEMLPSYPIPATFQGCRITPLIDSESYLSELKMAFATVGTGATKESNAGHFIFIASWWLDLLGMGRKLCKQTKIQVTSVGGTDLLSDEVVLQTEFDDANAKAKAKGRDPATGKFIPGWYPFSLDGLEDDTMQGTVDISVDTTFGPNTLIGQLWKKAAAGVDVRVLVWVSWAALAYGDYTTGLPIVGTVPATPARPEHIRLKTLDELVAGWRGQFSISMKSVEVLRLQPDLKCCLNILSHPAGGVHSKLVIVGKDSEARGFTGSLDFLPDRYSNELHTYGYRHEVIAKVEGPAVQALYDLFKDMWNEVLARPVKQYVVTAPTRTVATVVPHTSQIPARTLSTTAVGKHHVQSVRTVPAAHYKSVNLFKLPKGPAVSFAPAGIFEAARAWRKAILSAERYIYMEDWAFWSVEIMGWMAEAIRNNPRLKVILVTGSADPNDAKFPDYLVDAVNNGLLAATPPQSDQVRMFGRPDIHVHAKTTLIDDHWVIIGSVCCSRRSLYTDFEHSIAVLDEDDQFANAYRVDLWGDQLGLASDERAPLANLDNALDVWWQVPGSVLTLPDYLHRWPLPIPGPPLGVINRLRRNLVEDVDSREPWGVP